MLYAHSLELQINHRSRRILRKCLIHFDRDFCSGYHFAPDQMIFEDLVSKCLSHNDLL